MNGPKVTDLKKDRSSKINNLQEFKDDLEAVKDPAVKRVLKKLFKLLVGE